MAAEYPNFRAYPPEAGKIILLYDNLDIVAINVHASACEGVNVYDALETVQSIIVKLGFTEYTLNITNRFNQGNYYHYIIQRVTVGSILELQDIASCTLVRFLPSITDSSFVNSDYDVQINNINEQRRSTYVQDVDRKRSQVEPANLTAILNDSAVKTDVPDSNYSDTGLTNARYYGSETSEADFGITAALTAQAFKGYTYRNNDISTLICSASDDDRPTETEYVFALDKDYSYGNLNTSFDLGNSNIVSRSVMRETDSPNMRLTQVRTTTLNTTFNVLSTEIEFRTADGDVTQDFTTGLHLVGTPGSVMEYVNVTDISFNGTNTILTVDRRVLSYLGITSNCGIIYGPPQNTIFTILRVTGDTIYGTENNQIFKITDKKIYYPTTNEIFVVDKNGMIVYTDTTCLR